MLGEIIRNGSDRIQTLYEEHVLPMLRERLFTEKMATHRFSKRMFEFTRHFFQLGSIPFVRDLLPQFDPEKSSVSWLPINQDIEGAGEIALPLAVLDRFIEKAKHRVIVNYCGCRKAMRCNGYPDHIGCLMMGESALEIPAKSSREVGMEEAKAHVRMAIAAGLIPVTGKARIDNDIFMIPDRGKLLTVCFCCECCCISRYSRYTPRDILDGMHHPVEGLTLEVTDDCIGCGTCVSKCYIHAIEIAGGRAVISDMCRVCGRCAMNCPQEAIKLRLANPHAAEDVVRRIEALVDF